VARRRPPHRRRAIPPRRRRIVRLPASTHYNNHEKHPLSLLIWGCQKPAPENPLAADTIQYYEQCLFRPGDFSSANWRIPAICCLPDGTLLITCDRHKYNESDLPEDIDIVSRRSTDNGRTWNDPVTIAQGNGRKHGYGDAALVVCSNGDVVCAFVGGNGLFASSESGPIRSYI